MYSLIFCFILSDDCSPSSCSILLGLWCFRLCLSTTEKGSESISERSNSNTFTFKCKKNLKDSSFLSLAECLSSSATKLFLQSKYNNAEEENSNENIYPNKSKYMDKDKEKKKDEENEKGNKKEKEEEKDKEINKKIIVDDIVNIFNDLWHSCVSSSGQSYLILHYLRDLVEENHDNDIYNDNGINRNDVNSNCNGMNNKNKCNKTDIKTIIYFLLSSINLISIQYHPRLFFILSWLVKEGTTEHSSKGSTEHSSDSDIFIIPKDLSILNYSLLQTRKEKTNNYKNANMIINTKNLIDEENLIDNNLVSQILENYFHLRLNLIFSTESSNELNATTLQAQGLLLSKVFAKVRKINMITIIIINIIIIIIIMLLIYYY